MNNPDWQRQLHQPDYLEDGGFTTNVLKALPRRREPPWGSRAALAIGCAALSAALSLFVFSGADFITQSVRQVIQSPISSLPWLCIGLLVVLICSAAIAHADV